jgi:hypothetical protein
VETVGIRQVMWFIMLESAKDWNSSMRSSRLRDAPVAILVVL